MDRFRLLGHLKSALWRSTGFATVWVVLVGPDFASWIVGGPAVVAATLASLKLSAPRAQTLSMSGLARFIPYFLWESLRGGLDVAARVLLPKMRVQPGITLYRIRLRSASARLVFIDSVSLLPGTLSADLNGDLLAVHALDIEADVDTELTRLEERVADLFSESLEATSVEPGQVGRPPIERGPIGLTSPGLLAR